MSNWMAALIPSPLWTAGQIILSCGFSSQRGHTWPRDRRIAGAAPCGSTDLFKCMRYPSGNRLPGSVGQMLSADFQRLGRWTHALSDQTF